MHEMGGFDREKARRTFNIPEDYEVGIMIAIEYQDSFQVLHERYRETAHSPRKRKPLSEIVSFAELGNEVTLDQLSGKQSCHNSDALHIYINTGYEATAVSEFQ
jgi:hypothetical protein